MTLARDGDLFYKNLIGGQAGADGYVRRAWLEDAVLRRVSKPACRFVLVTGEPGAGKSGLMAGLADRRPDWLRHFIRRDSIVPLSDGSAAEVLLRLGYQFASLWPEAFDPGLLEIAVRQRVEAAEPGSEVTGLRIDDLQVSPFRRTVLTADQEVGRLGGQLTGIEVARATIEPRLLTTEVLQYMALLDPTAVLASTRPGMMIVALIDALDEVADRSGQTVLDWLGRCPEPPPNLRFVLTSRPGPHLDVLRGRGDVEVIELDVSSAEVLGDALAFARHMLSRPEVSGAVPDSGAAAQAIAHAARGNFAYLRAYERALTDAASTGNSQLRDSLLRLETLPDGLSDLYARLLRNLRQEVTRMGMLEIERPLAVGDELASAWSGAAQRMLGVLAVARAPLTLDQLMRLGSVRVWRSSANEVLCLLAPFLDHVGPGWVLFHPSVAEFLAGDAARSAPDLGIDGREWRRRVVRAYRGGAASWAEVDWTRVDDYGLLHLPGHIAELIEPGEQGDIARRELAGLVNAGLLAASRARYVTDLPFKGVIGRAIAEASGFGDPAEALATTIFLGVVNAEVTRAAGMVSPAVFGLMARLGRLEEALARAELLGPLGDKPAALKAIIACTPREQRQLLGAHDGAALLERAALEIPVTVDPPGFRGQRRTYAIEEAAVAMAAHDLERAMDLVSKVADERFSFRGPEAVLAAATAARDGSDALPLIKQMRKGQAQAAVAAAARTAPGERGPLLEAAEQHLHLRDRKDADSLDAADRITVLAELVAGWSPVAPKRAARAGKQLRAEVAGQLRANVPPVGTVVHAARAVRPADLALAEWLLDQATSVQTTNAQSTVPTDLPADPPPPEAVTCWAQWGHPDKARAVAERILAYERALGWYGPAGRIAGLATRVDSFDPQWARQLADEAVTLIENAATGEKDPHERPQVDMTLGEVATAFRTWSPKRALRAARLMSDAEKHRINWDHIAGRTSALALLGIDAAETDPGLAARLLGECEPQRRLSSPGRPDARLIRGGLFRPAEDDPSTQPSTNTPRLSHFGTYGLNCINSWQYGREWRPYHTPADVLRSMQMPPETFGSPASWAGVVAAAVGWVAARDVDAAIAMTGWLADPAERLIACASLVRRLVHAGDPRSGTSMRMLGRTAVSLPRYVCEVFLDKVPQGPVLRYLDPSARARWEAARLLPADMPAATALCRVADSWYLDATLRAQFAWDALTEPVPDGTPPDEVIRVVNQALVSFRDHPDDVQLDLLRLACVGVLTAYSPDQAVAVARQITHAGISAVTQMYLAAGTAPEGSAPSVAARCRQALDAIPESNLMPLHYAWAASVAAHNVGPVYPASARELTEQGVKALRPAPGLAGIGLRLLADTADESLRAGLVRGALARADDLDDLYIRYGALADLLAPSVRTRDPDIVATVTQRLLDEGWQVLMEGLRRAVPALVETMGAAVIPHIDQALREAQRVLTGGGAEPGHLDGVASPSLRQDPLAEEEQAAASAPPVRLDVNALYLDDADLPDYLSLGQDSRDHAPDPDDYAFAGCDGAHVGLRAWNADPTSVIGRLVDIRFVFPDEARAAAYHAERLFANSELRSEVADAPAVGEDCHVFGGPAIVEMGTVRFEMTMYYYVFRVRNVVVKLFASQGESAASRLTPEYAQQIAERAAARCRR